MKKAIIITLVLLLAAAAVGANYYFKRERGLEVTAEPLRTRELE